MRHRIGEATIRILCSAYNELAHFSAFRSSVDEACWRFLQCLLLYRRLLFQSLARGRLLSLVRLSFGRITLLGSRGRGLLGILLLLADILDVSSSSAIVVGGVVGEVTN